MLPTLSIPIQYSTLNFSYGNKTKREIKGMQIEDEFKVSLFLDGINLYIKYPKEMIKKASIANKLSPKQQEINNLKILLHMTNK